MNRKFNATAMWFYRMMLETSWTVRLSNEESLKKQEMILLLRFRKRRLAFLALVIRKESLDILALTRHNKGKCGKGKHWIIYLGRFCKWMIKQGLWGIVRKQNSESCGEPWSPRFRKLLWFSNSKCHLKPKNIFKL